MTLLKKIILTMIFIASILLIQSYVFSESCTLTPSNASLRALSLGCEGDVCNFSLVKDSDVSSGYSSCASGCDDSAYQTNYSICMNSCYSENINPSQEIYLTESMSFNRNSVCSDKKINLSLASDVNFEMKETKTNLFIKGIDSLNTNGKNITVFVNNNDKLGNATFRFDFSNLLVSNSSKIIMSTKERTSQADSINGGYGDWKRDGIKFYFNNLEITEGSSLDLNMYIPKNILNVEDNIGMPITSLAGGELTFDGNSVVNNGNFNINLRAQDSQDGRSFNNQGVGWENPDGTGGTVKEAGHVFFNLNYLENNGLLASEIFSGNGGIGGNGSRSGTNRKTPGYGGKGGDAGSIFFYIDYIDNHSNLDFNLVSGDGGHGGNTGFDNGGPPTADYAEGGDGGNGGNIYLCKVNWIAEVGFVCATSSYNSLINKGNFNLVANTGFGNNGGNKNNHDDIEGKGGDGGNGGSYLSSLKFDFIRNSGSLNIFIDTGYGGLKGLGVDGGEDGVGGRTPNVFIKFLENSSENLNIFLNSKHEINQYKSDVTIDKLQNGSYLPSKIYTVFTYKELVYSDECIKACGTTSCSLSCIQTEDIQTVTQNRKIKINDACYVKQPSSGLDYMTGSIEIKSANKDDFKDLLPENVSSTLTNNSECVICDYYDFKNLNDIFPEDSSEKFHKKYTLYSTVQDTIPAGSLKFYYAKNNINFDKVNALYNPFTKQNNLPVYTNKNSIFPVLNEKLGLYEYLIDSSNLEWYYDPSLDLENKNLFCYNQNYRLEGSIGSKSFNFPFTPIFKK